jgi:hypothetical protein
MAELLDQNGAPLLDQNDLPLTDLLGATPPPPGGGGTGGGGGVEVGPDPFDWSPLEEEKHVWRVAIITGGEAWHLPQYSGISLTLTHDGVRASIEIPTDVVAIGYIRDLVSDLIYYRDDVEMYRLRVVDSEDIVGRDGSMVRFECVSYEHLLKRRILREDRILTDEDIDAAWWLISYTQAFHSLGITRGTLTPGVSRQRTLSAGTDINTAINDFAIADGGFDWWIDSQLRFWAAKPRRGVELDIDWLVGGQVAEMQRLSPIEDYASVILATGATGETRIPDGAGGETVYPPPPPQLVQSPSMPFGLWETAVSYSDVVTAGSLLTKANWNLLDKGNIRPTYKLTLEPGTWHPGIHLGDVVRLRVVIPPRVDIKVPIRIEEMQIECSTDGSETVTMSVRAEEPETFVTPSPIGPIPTVPLADPNGKTVQRRRLSGTDEMASVMRSLHERLQAQERAPGPTPEIWVPYTVAWYTDGSAIVMGATTLQGWYRKSGKAVDYRIAMNVGAGWGGGTQRWSFSLPFPAASAAEGGFEQDDGTVKLWCALGNMIGFPHIPATSTRVYPLAPQNATSQLYDFVRNADASAAAGTGIPNIPGYYTFENPGRNLIISGTYIAAV